MTKTALVTGAGRRFGFEVAKALIEEATKYLHITTVQKTVSTSSVN